ncbi:hypothetical protein D3C77_347080 [compost metagenome]
MTQPARIAQLDVASAEEFLARKPAWVKSDQTPTDAAALIAMVQVAKPKAMVEIGTSAGEGAAAMLYGTQTFGSELFSLDLSETVYYDRSKPIGAVVDEAFPEFLPRYQRRTGVMCDAVRTLDRRFDFVHIDGAHAHPWATVDFLRCLPFLNEGALVAFHDANYMAAISQAAYYFARILPGEFVGNHFLLRYEGPTDTLFQGLMDVLEINWQQNLAEQAIVNLYEDLLMVFPAKQAGALCARVLERHANYQKFTHLYSEVHGALWKREIERRKLLSEAKP